MPFMRPATDPNSVRALTSLQRIVGGSRSGRCPHPSAIPIFHRIRQNYGDTEKTELMQLNNREHALPFRSATRLPFSN